MLTRNAKFGRLTLGPRERIISEYDLLTVTGSYPGSSITLIRIRTSEKTLKHNIVILCTLVSAKFIFDGAMESVIVLKLLF
jgi:hypothetical protein